MAANQTYLKCRQRVLEFLYERHHFVDAACAAEYREQHERASGRHRQRNGRGAVRRGAHARALGRYSVAVLGNEGKLAYNRIAAVVGAGGRSKLCDIELQSGEWWTRRGRHAALRSRRGVGRSRDPARAARDRRHASLQASRLRHRLAPIRPATPGMDKVLTFATSPM
jgi:hypothetical protein